MLNITGKAERCGWGRTRGVLGEGGGSLLCKNNVAAALN